MASSELRLLGSWASPFVLRPMIALNLKSLEYEFLQQTPGSKSQLLLQSNPVYKKIPVLLHGDKPICESLIIVQYIDDVWTNGPSILPADPYDRAIARFWASYIDDKVKGVFYLSIMLFQWFPSVLAILPGVEANAAVIEQVESGLKLLEEAFKKYSRGNGLFGGESIGYIDIALGSYLGWLKAAEVMNNLKFLDDEKTPLLSAWSKRFCTDVAVKEIMPEAEKLIDATTRGFSKNRIRKMESV